MASPGMACSMEELQGEKFGYSNSFVEAAHTYLSIPSTLLIELVMATLVDGIVLYGWFGTAVEAVYYFFKRY